MIKIDKKLIIVIALLVIAAAIAVIFLIPSWQSVRGIKNEISRKKTELANIEDLIIKVNQIKKQGRNTEKELAEVYLALPKEKDIPDLLVYFESLSISNGLILESIDFGEIGGKTKKVESKSGLKSREVKLIVSGTYNAFKKYLRALEENIRSMNAGSISFDSRNLFADPDSDFLEFRLEVEVFYQ